MKTLTADKLYTYLKENKIFCDYFNKFCCLPVFGQRLTYMPKKDQFSFDPTPIRRRPKELRVSNDQIRNWIIDERIALFYRSVLGSEYNLCSTLNKMNYSKSEQKKSRSNSKGLKALESNPNLDQLIGFELLDDLKQKHFQKVRHMKNFIDFVEKEKPNNKLVSFWIDADHVKKSEPENKKLLLRDLQKKYYNTSSPNCLSYHLLEKVYREKVSRDFNGYGIYFTTQLQSYVLNKLHSYWLPRYLLSRKNTEKSEETLIKKLKIVQSENIEKELHEKSIHASKFRRQITSSHEILQEENQFSGRTLAELWEGDKDLKEFVDKVGIETFEDQPDFKKPRVKKSMELLSRGSYFERQGPPVDKSLITQSSALLDNDDNFQMEKPLLDDKSRKGEWRKYPVSKTSFFLEKLDSRPSSSDSSNSSKSSLDNNIHQQCYWSQDFQDNNLESWQSLYGSGLALKKFKKIKRIKRRLGPVHSDIMPQIQLKKEKDKTPAVRKCVSDIKQVRFSLPEIPKCKSNIEEKSQFYPPQFNSDMQVHESSPAVIDTRLKESGLNFSMFDLGDGFGESEMDFTEKSPKRVLTSKPIQSQVFFSKRKKQSPQHKVVYEDAEEYLNHVESCISLSDILACDSVAAFPFRNFLMKVEEQGSVNITLITAAGDYIQNLEFVKAYRIWQEAEQIRLTFFSLSSFELKKRIDEFLDKYASNPDLPLFYLKQMKLKNDKPFPSCMTDLQQEIENLMQPLWLKYASAEQEQFQSSVIFIEKKTYKRRNSFPSSIPEIMQDPILPVPFLLKDVEDKYDHTEFENQIKSGKMESLSPSGFGTMKYRISRSFRLLTGLESRTAFTKETKFMRFVDEESSDDEGELPMSRPKIFVRLPELSMKELAKMSAPDYLRPTPEYRKQCLELKMRMKHTLTSTPIYLQPVKRHGVIVQRPKERPESLDEVVRDPIHFEFFKKYLKMHNSDAPLLFWKAVESLKRVKNTNLRQAKATKILHTFFGKSAGRGMVLQCENVIIKDIAMADTVTTSMLVEAANEVYKSMDQNWTSRYFKTFNDPDSDEEDDENIEDAQPFNFDFIKRSQFWLFFSDFIRSVACFLKSMQIPKEYYNFRMFLKDLPKMFNTKKLHSRSASSTALLFEQYETTYFRNYQEDLQMKFLKKKFQDRELILNFIVNDFVFFCETQKFIAYCNNVKRLKKSGEKYKEDIKLLKEKRGTIIKCFINSDIPPNVRINISILQSEEIMAVSRRNEVNRTMFFRARMTIFPVIMFFWKRYCYGKLHYESKRETKMKHADEVEQRRKEMLNAKKQKLLQKTIGLQSMEPDTFLPETFPVKKRNKKIEYEEHEKMERVKGLVHTDPPKLHFSLETGLKFIIPPKIQLVEKVKGVEEEEDVKTDMLKVWTRNAKVVQVIAQGSNPILAHLGRNKDFVVKCDMIPEENSSHELKPQKR